MATAGARPTSAGRGRCGARASRLQRRRAAPGGCRCRRLRPVRRPQHRQRPPARPDDAEFSVDKLAEGTYVALIGRQAGHRVLRRPADRIAGRRRRQALPARGSGLARRHGLHPDHHVRAQRALPAEPWRSRAPRRRPSRDEGLAGVGPEPPPGSAPRPTASRRCRPRSVGVFSYLPSGLGDAPVTVSFHQFTVDPRRLMYLSERPRQEPPRDRTRRAPQHQEETGRADGAAPGHRQPADRHLLGGDGRGPADLPDARAGALATRLRSRRRGLPGRLRDCAPARWMGVRPRRPTQARGGGRVCRLGSRQNRVPDRRRARRHHGVAGRGPSRQGAAHGAPRRDDRCRERSPSSRDGLRGASRHGHRRCRARSRPGVRRARR